MTGGLLANERPAAPLERCLHELFESQAAQIVSQARLKEHVHRVLVDVDGVQHSLVVKWSDPATAHRTRLVARRWLAAAGLKTWGRRCWRSPPSPTAMERGSSTTTRPDDRWRQTHRSNTRC